MSHFAIAGLQLELSAAGQPAPGAQRTRASASSDSRGSTWPCWASCACSAPNKGNAQPLPGRVEEELGQIARDLQLWLIPGSIYERDGDRIYNTTPVINSRGEVVARYRKMFPFLPYETGVTPGAEFVVFDVPDVGRFGVSICYDMWFPETTRTLAWMGAEVITAPHDDQHDRSRTSSFRSRAPMPRSTSAISSTSIARAGSASAGRVIVGPDGTVLHQAGIGHEIMPVEIDLEHGAAQPATRLDGPRPGH